MTAVVIGSGPSPQGKGWGQQIDAADYVVRMWDWHWQGPEDYGARCDAALITTTPPYMARANGLVVCKPDMWCAYDIHGHWRQNGGLAVWQDRPVEMFHVDRWAEMARDAGFTGLSSKPRRFDLTRGLAAVAWLAETRKPTRLVLVGLDGAVAGHYGGRVERYAVGAVDAFNFRPGEKFPAPKDDGQRTPSHDAAGERWLLGRIAEETGVEIVAAETIWP